MLLQYTVRVRVRVRVTVILYYYTVLLYLLQTHTHTHILLHCYTVREECCMLQSLFNYKDQNYLSVVTETTEGNFDPYN
jgi:hypothetical protein